MGLGDEIMALGRAETIYKRTGKPVTIHGQGNVPRWHPAWDGNPAVVKSGGQVIIDGPGARPYIERWDNSRIIFNMDYRPRAGKIILTENQIPLMTLPKRFAVIAPFLKDGASPNKDWGVERWEQVIADFPIPVLQLCEDENVRGIKGAQRILTKTFRHAYWIISKAALVMCNEGGSHHMAASAETHAVVIFGAFVPPTVTGYPIHHNIAVETEQGYCGNWEPCGHCRAAMATIKPETVRAAALGILESRHES